MKLQRQASRSLKDKKYAKWVITLPPSLIEQLGWKEGEELETQELKNALILRSSKVKDKTNYITYKIKGSLTDRKKLSRAQKFSKIYNSLPLSERLRVVLVIDDESISWKMADLHIRNNTKLGNNILKELEKLKII